DGDILHQHNAFRAPGAASGDELAAEPKKVAYFGDIYSKMRRGIVSHPAHVDASNIDELRDADFVFVCIDDGPAKAFIIESKPPLRPEVIERVVEMTLADPPGERTHWTGRAMAQAAGVSHRSVQRIWAAHGLKPHRVRTFKLSNDAKFAAKVQDVVGLYIDPPEHALVLSVDEKSQIQ